MGKIADTFKGFKDAVKDSYHNTRYSKHLEKHGGRAFQNIGELREAKGSLAAYDRLSNDLFKYDTIEEILKDRALVETFIPEGKSTLSGTICENKCSDEIQNGIIKDTLFSVQNGIKIGNLPVLDSFSLPALFACGSYELLQTKVEFGGEKVSVGDYYIRIIDEEMNRDLGKAHYSFYNGIKKEFEDLKENAEIINQSAFLKVQNNDNFQETGNEIEEQ